jgi:hypothetical protein
MSEQRPRLVSDPPFCEPFINGRNAGRLLFDLGAMISLLKPEMLDSEHPRFRRRLMLDHQIYRQDGATRNCL